MERLQSLYDKKSLPEVKYIEMQTNLEKARSSEAISHKNLEDSRLTAPFNGVAGKTNVAVGENVLPNQSIVTVLQIDKVNVKVSVPENEIHSIQVGQTVTLEVSALNDAKFSGVIKRKGVSADLISHAYPIHIVVNNKNHNLLPGMVCDVFISENKNNKSIIIPNECIHKDGSGKSFVWKIEDGCAKKQVVETGQQNFNGVEVNNGVKAGDEIISEGYQKLINGLKVSVL